jgi:arylsulfatase A-like enzyme
MNFFCIGLLLLGLVASLSASEGRPNILFVFADDQCHEALSRFGSQVQTPNLDRLAEQGTVFRTGYNPGAWGAAVCASSRTMLNTGRSLWRAHALHNSWNKDDQPEGLWSQLMADAGYATYMSGKWHVKVAPDAVFQTTSNVRGGMPKQTKAGYNRPKDAADYANGWKPWDPQHGGFWEGGKHWSEVLADDGIAFIEQAAESDQPFFMYLAFNAPHDPRQAPKQYVDQYPLESIEVPVNTLPEYPYNKQMGSPRGLRDERLAPFPRTDYSVKVNLQEYYAIITHMDAQIGRILEALEASGKADNTVILFTADHGLAVGQHGLMGKQNMFEHSMRAPLILSGPGIPQAKEITTPVYLQDVMPTTLELAGREIPAEVDFKSLLPLVRGERTIQYPAICGAYRDKQRMVRLDRYKLIYYPSADVTLLFDLEEDPHEMKNLAQNPEYAETLRKCWETLKELQVEVGDPLDLEGKG